ncbi:hypothetical protein BS78_01G237500 [Paspalum vaginatum]|nr:hypothetical protein BS78_01G237500 [Paspalum vaginatum]
MALWPCSNLPPPHPWPPPIWLLCHRMSPPSWCSGSTHNLLWLLLTPTMAAPMALSMHRHRLHLHEPVTANGQARHLHSAVASASHGLIFSITEQDAQKRSTSVLLFLHLSVVLGTPTKVIYLDFFFDSCIACSFFLS